MNGSGATAQLARAIAAAPPSAFPTSSWGGRSSKSQPRAANGNFLSSCYECSSTFHGRLPVVPTDQSYKGSKGSKQLWHVERDGSAGSPRRHTPSRRTRRERPPSSSTARGTDVRATGRSSSGDDDSDGGDDLPHRGDTAARRTIENDGKSGRRNLIRQIAASASLLALFKTALIDGVISVPDPADAFSLGTSGPKEWLVEQKRKSARFLLTPIEVSRGKLDEVLSLFSHNPGDGGDDQGGEGGGDGGGRKASALTPSTGISPAIRDREAYKIATSLVRSASRDCMPLQSGSLIELQSKAIEVCTFRLILKNAASLLDDDDIKKVQANAALTNLVASFVSLDNAISKGASLTADAGAYDSAATDRTGARQGVLSATKDTQKALDLFSDRIRIVLGLPQ